MSHEVVHLQSLKQQGQLLSSTAAVRIIESTASFDSIETEVLELADQLELEGVAVDISRFDSEIVEIRVDIDYGLNSVLGSVLNTQIVNSTNYSYRVESP